MTAPRSNSSPLDLSPRLTALLVFAAALLVYWPALTGSLLWDDNAHVTRADLRGLAGLVRIWTDIGATQQYYPLLHSAFWLEHHLWGDAVLGYHLLNVLLHATAACLFAAVLRRLAIPGATLAALLFALHPVCVESVAWISEQKNTLSAVLYLAAALCYLRYDRERRTADYAWASGLFVTALLTKSVTVTLPAALLVIFWWQRGRVELKRDVVPLLPWLAAGMAGGLLTAAVERGLIGASGGQFELSFIQRGLLAGRALWFYLGKLLWPAELVFIYPRWTLDAGAAWQWLFPLGAIGLVAAGVWWTRHSRAPLAVLLLFGGTLFPALGFFNVFPFLFSFVADHFQYLASLAVVALLAAAFSRLPIAVVRPGAVALLVGLGLLSRAECSKYRDAETLYVTTLAANPRCWMAENNLGAILVARDGQAAAIPHFERSLQLYPDNAEAENNLGNALNEIGRPTEALPHFRHALELMPQFAAAYNSMGAALNALGRRDEAITAFRRALEAKPQFPLAAYNLGLALAYSNRTAEAVVQFERAAKLDPHYPEAELNWGTGLAVLDRIDESLPHFRRALELKPDFAEAHIGLGRALAYSGKIDEALPHFQTAVELAPESAEAHVNLGLAYRKLGREADAVREFMTVERLQKK